MTKNVLWLIYYLTYGMELFLIGEEIFHNRVKDKKRYVIYIIVYIAILLPIIMRKGEVGSYITIPLYLFLYSYLFQGEILSQSMRFIGIHACIGAVDAFVNVVCHFVFSDGIDKFLVIDGWLIYSLITGIICIYMVRRKRIQKMIRYFCVLKLSQRIAIIGMIFIGTFFIAATEVILEYINNSVGITALQAAIVFAMIIIFSVVVWLVTSIHNEQYYFIQNKMKEGIIHAQRKQNKDTYKNNKEISQFRHEINSQLSMLWILLKSGKVEHAIALLEKNIGKFDQLNINKYHTGDEILDGIINLEYGRVRERGIALKVVGKIETADFMDYYDLCAIVSNALKNGIEACEKVQDAEKIIGISILERNHMIVLCFTNPATEEMYKAATKGKTTKADKKHHGYGIEIIRMAVERNNGRMQYLFENGKLILEISFEI